MVILLNSDNKYKGGVFREGEVFGETREWVNVSSFDWDFFENTI